MLAQHIIATHPSNFYNEELPPDHTLMVEACMTKHKKIQDPEKHA